MSDNRQNVSLIVCQLYYILISIMSLSYSAQAVGSTVKVPYSSIATGKCQVTVENLPTGVKLRKPSDYGRHVLEHIIANEESIRFTIG